MIADLKPYPAMKDSGVPWLGEMPLLKDGGIETFLRREVVEALAALRES